MCDIVPIDASGPMKSFFGRSRTVGEELHGPHHFLLLSTSRSQVLLSGKISKVLEAIEEEISTVEKPFPEFHLEDIKKGGSIDALPI